MRFASTAARCVAAALVGVVASVAVVLEAGRWWGLLLGIAAVVATTFAWPPGWSTRLPFGAAYIVALVILMQPRPEGDFLIAADAHGYLVFGLALVVLTATISTLPRPRASHYQPPTTHNGAHDQHST